MELQSDFALCVSMCVYLYKVLGFRGLKANDNSPTPTSPVYSLHKLTTNSLECLQRVQTIKDNFLFSQPADEAWLGNLKISLDKE